MIMEESKLVVADNTGAKIAKCFRVLGQRKRTAGVGDIIRVSIQEATPLALSRRAKSASHSSCVRLSLWHALMDLLCVSIRTLASSLTLSTTRWVRAFLDLLHANCVTRVR